MEQKFSQYTASGPDGGSVKHHPTDFLCSCLMLMPRNWCKTCTTVKTNELCLPRPVYDAFTTWLGLPNPMKGNRNSNNAESSLWVISHRACQTSIKQLETKIELESAFEVRGALALPCLKQLTANEAVLFGSDVCAFIYCEIMIQISTVAHVFVSNKKFRGN